ncbi:uncharacterized protein LOC125572180 [Nematostella vectensis]|uniref:uncharacterized protein LOC125572180 n=1 Tax=Nematostella vectensis TaxID=45351 RepID=UPI002076EBDD|nr:uncharacterized protein LOC125572180 [Nematostella vectensis]
MKTKVLLRCNQMLEGRISALAKAHEEEVKDLKKTISKLHSEISALKKQVGTIKTSLEFLETSVINEAEEPAPSPAPDRSTSEPTSSPERVVEEQVSPEISQQPRRLSVSSTEEDRGQELTTVRENNPVPKALIIGDSMIKGINENRLSQSLIVRSGTKETLQYLKSLDDNVVYESVFIHTGTNDIRGYTSITQIEENIDLIIQEVK